MFYSNNEHPLCRKHFIPHLIPATPWRPLCDHFHRHDEEHSIQFHCLTNSRKPLKQIHYTVLNEHNQTDSFDTFVQSDQSTVFTHIITDLSIFLCSCTHIVCFNMEIRTPKLKSTDKVNIFDVLPLFRRFFTVWMFPSAAAFIRDLDKFSSLLFTFSLMDKRTNSYIMSFFDLFIFVNSIIKALINRNHFCSTLITFS